MEDDTPLKRVTFLVAVLPPFLFAATIMLSSCSINTTTLATQNETSEKSLTLETVVSGIREKLDSVGAYSADTKTFSSRLLRKRGRFYYKAPYLMRWEEYGVKSGKLISIALITNKDDFLYFPQSNTLYSWPYNWETMKFANLAPFVGAVAPGERIELLDSEELDGKVTYVIEMTDTTSNRRQGWRRVRGYFDEESGLLVRIVTFDHHGELITDTRFQEFDLGTQLDDVFFTFVPPEGTKLFASE